MYAALWRILPGPSWLRIVLLVLIALAVVAALFTWVFPWVDSIINPQRATLGMALLPEWAVSA